MTTRILATALGLAALLAAAGCGKYGPPMRSEFPAEPAPPGVAPAAEPASAPAEAAPAGAAPADEAGSQP